MGQQHSTDLLVKMIKLGTVLIEPKEFDHLLIGTNYYDYNVQTNLDTLLTISTMLKTDKNINVQEIFHFAKEYFVNNIVLTQLFINHGLKFNQDTTFKCICSNDYIKFLINNGVRHDKISCNWNENLNAIYGADLELAILIIDDNIPVALDDTVTFWYNWRLIPHLLDRKVNFQ